MAISLVLTTAGAPPAGLQWRLSYGPDVVSINVASGPGLTSATKLVMCNPGSGSMMCVAYGVNGIAIDSGIIAQLTVQIASGASSSVAIAVTNVVMAFADGTGASIPDTQTLITVGQGPNGAPSIASLVPAAATAGAGPFTLMVSGSGFVNSSVTRWNGQDRTTTFVSGTQVQATISAADVATAGTAQVTVFNPAPGGGTSAAAAFTINATNPIPSITSLLPASAPAGTGAFTLTVNGNGFVSGSVVYWKGTNRATAFVSGSQLQAAIAAADVAVAGTAQVMVFNPAPGGGASAATGFTINSTTNQIASITSLSPAAATAGTGAFTLTVNGNGFVNGSVVYWNGANRQTTFVSGTQLQAAIATADVAAPGTAQVIVFNPAPGGGASATAAFTINPPPNPPPSITLLSPHAVTAGTGAFKLIVHGDGFVNGSAVNWNGQNRATTYVNGKLLQAEISAADVASTGTAQVMVFNPAPGGGASAAAEFTINPPPNPTPSITSLAPASATAGAGALTLTLNGSGFVNASAVRWNGESRTTTYVSGTKLKASISAADIASAGTAQVTVFNPAPGGGASAAAAFPINSPPNPTPSITALAPAAVTAGTGAFTLTISGSGYVNSSVAMWNGQNRTTTYVSGTQLKAAISAADIASAGTAQVMVFNPAPGGGASAPAEFTINSPANPTPSVTSIAPVATNAGTGAFTLTLNGSGFLSASAVKWNGQNRTTAYVSGTQLKAAISAADVASAGTAQVTVANPGGGASAAARFTITGAGTTGAPPPSPVSSQPASGSGNATFTFTFSDPRGWQDLGVVNILFNNVMDSRNACYLAYSRPLNILYLVTDDGGALLPGGGLSSSGSTSNSQCAVSWGNSAVAGDGNTMTLTLNIAFYSVFAGNKIVYMASGDVTGNYSGWNAMGVWQAPGAVQSTTTAAIGMNPAHSHGTAQSIFTFNFSDTLGHQDLGVENILINDSLDGRRACYLAYARQLNVLYLLNDAGDTLLPAQSLSAAGTVSNSQCTVSWGGEAVGASGNDLALTLNIAFNPPFVGGRVFYLAARDRNESNNTSWQSVGTWTAQ